ncbi:MAG TPA: hypothetical protein VN776_16190 [Terracidiphilus sp.]|nr:hypothetical protein [Terracidiphilus sp.]
MTPAPIPPAALDFILQMEGLYAALMQSANASSHGELSLGGRLLYAGVLDADSRALLVAGNIAGAASLAATADAAAQRQAIRDGVADFLVTSLDEALRILKNEIRKRETAAVCIAAAPEAVEREMRERGVLPDLLTRAVLPVARSGGSVMTWRVTAAPAQWLPKLDAIAGACLQASTDPETTAAHRWLRLAPRYLGRLAQGLRLLHCQPQVAKEFVSRVEDAFNRGEITVEVEIALGTSEQVFRFHPPSSSMPHT